MILGRVLPAVCLGRACCKPPDVVQHQVPLMISIPREQAKVDELFENPIRLFLRQVQHSRGALLRKVVGEQVQL